MTKHCGVINSDEVINRSYQQQYDSMVKRYRVEVVAPVPLCRRLWRWVLSQIGY